jgi:DNA-directed RNA polymerase subunit M/transcription elongation factor TFIIS
MPGTIPILELKPDGDVALSKVKYIGAKPVLKDLQTYTKKKSAPTLLTSYLYGAKRLSFFGFVKGREDELSQHQLPPPFESPELFGSILLIAHPVKEAWDTSIEQFSPADYEVFYEKACSGEIETEVEETEEEEEEAEEEEEVAVEEEEEEEEEGELEEEEEVKDEPMPEEEDIIPIITRTSRKAVKVDAQQLQFQYCSSLKPNMELTDTCKQRIKTFDIIKKICSEQCTETELLELEMGIYNASLEEAKRRLIPLTWDHETFCWIYTMISKRTLSNFYSESYVKNQHLVERWKDGEFTLKELGHWSSYELHPTFWKGLKDQQFRREQKILEGNIAMATDRFRCSRCQKKMTTYYELQTRSADEPMTIFISCVNCGKQWKQ